MTAFFFLCLQVQKEGAGDQALHGSPDVQRADSLAEEVRQLQRRKDYKGEHDLLEQPIFLS